MRVAIVTGASRGLGSGAAEALAKQNCEVIFAVRRPEMIKGHLENLRKQGLKVEAIALDLSSEESIRTFAHEIQKKYSAVDILINNAGIFIDNENRSSADKLKATFLTNTLGPYLLTQELWSLLKKAKAARVVNVSSGMGQLSEMAGGSPAYRISKTALNAVTKIFAAEVQGSRVLVNSVCPGWVKTDMGGSGAPRTIEQGISGILWAANLPVDGPNGGFFRDGQRIDLW